MIAIPASGGFPFYLCTNKTHIKLSLKTLTTLTKEQDRFWKRIFIRDDDSDVTITFKIVIEDSNDTA